MADSLNDSNSTVCSLYDTHPYVIVAAVSSGSAMVSALCCIFVIGLIFLFKKHIFFTQRLIIYHCLAALVRAIALILRLHRLGYKNDSTSLKVLCAISGFMDQLSLWYLLVDYSVITFTLFMTAVFHKNVARLEGLFIVLIFVFPLTFNWIPFINDSYGRSRSWCWIRIINFDDCSEHKFGKILQVALWVVPFYLFFIIILPIYITVIVFVAKHKCCSKRYSVLHDQGEETFRKRLNEDVWPLLFFPFGVFAINLFPVANGIYNILHDDVPSYELTMASAIMSPLQGGYIALIYTLDRETIRRLNYKNLMAILCGRRQKIREYPTEVGARSDSFKVDEGLESDYNKFVDDDKNLLLLQTSTKDDLT